MKITNSCQSYTIDETQIVTDSEAHNDICNDIAAQYVADENEADGRTHRVVEAEFIRVIDHATANMPAGGTFSDWNRLCASALAKA